MCVVCSPPNHTLVPLRAVGPDWEPQVSVASDLPELTDEERLPRNSQAAEPSPAKAVEDDGTPGPLPFNRLHLPVIFSHTPPPTHPDDEPRAGCPCGWFDDYYRLLDVVPGPTLDSRRGLNN